MKMVRMTRDVRPYQKNETPVLPDAAARRLLDDGDAQDMGDWPERGPDMTHVTPTASETPAPARRMRTKGTGA